MINYSPMQSKLIGVDCLRSHMVPLTVVAAVVVSGVGHCALRGSSGLFGSMGNNSTGSARIESVRISYMHHVLTGKCFAIIGALGAFCPPHDSFNAH